MGNDTLVLPWGLVNSVYKYKYKYKEIFCINTQVSGITIRHLRILYP